MVPDSRIAAASAALQAHLRQSFDAGWGDTTLPAVTGAPLPAAGAAEARDVLLVYLYRVEVPEQVRNAPPRRDPGERSTVPAQRLDLHYLITAFAAEEARAQAMLECAFLRLHAAPVIAAAPPLPEDPPLRTVPVPLSLDETIALWRSLGLPQRPALAYRVAVTLETSGDAGPAPPVREPER